MVNDNVKEDDEKEVEERGRNKNECQHCKKPFKAKGTTMHEKTCPQNPRFQEEKCGFCGRWYKGITGLRIHQARCSEVKMAENRDGNMMEMTLCRGIIEVTQWCEREERKR